MALLHAPQGALHILGSALCFAHILVRSLFREFITLFFEIQPSYTQLALRLRRVGSPILVGARLMHNSTLPAYAILQKIRYTT